MARIDFDTIMAFHSNNPWVYEKLLEAVKGHGTVIPFVGAGLSVFCKYPSWPQVLTEQAKSIRNEAKRAEIQALISRNDLLEAAEQIDAADRLFIHKVSTVFSPSGNKATEDAFRTSAAWVLPDLFPQRPAITTNFDPVLETVYEKRAAEFQTLLGPTQIAKLSDVRQHNLHALLKLHGCMSPPVNRSNIVFTRTQYDEAYRDGSPLVRELQQWFRQYTLLFLGCSLQADRPLEVLKELYETETNLVHYAIVGCPAEQLDQRSNALVDQGVFPIVYDDTDPRNHESVRVILERLLEATDQPRYQRLIRDSRVIPPVTKAERSLLFDADYFPFSGRETELQRLGEFCAQPKTNLWWAVTGPGGMGKSRLVYEFCKSMALSGWKTHRFEARPTLYSKALPLTELKNWEPGVEKTILVLDDVQAHTQLVFDWLQRAMYRHRSEPLRVLLLERDGTGLSDASWLGSDFRNTGLEEWCADPRFLRLEPMDDDQLLELMTNYAKAAGKSTDPAPLLKVLETVDPKCKRPLYAIAITDAQCRGQDPTAWERKKVLDALKDRELAFHHNRFRGLAPLNDTLRRELDRLLAQICIYGPLSPENLDLTRYRHLSRFLEDSYLDPADFYNRLGLLRWVDDRQVLTLSCPDLIREHLVLDLYEQKRLELLPEGWTTDRGRLLFLARLWVDYPDRLRDLRPFWDRFFRAQPPAPGPAVELYGTLLWGGIYYIPDLTEHFIRTLSDWHESHPKDPDIALAYANGLYNLSNDQSSQDRAVTIDRLEDLYSEHRGSLDIALLYAMGLFNLSNEQSPQDRAVTIDRLEDLYREHRDSRDIALQYAMGLFNLLCVQQSPQDCAATIDRLEDLYSEHRGSLDIALPYAMGLFNLSNEQSPQDRAVTIDRLEDLYREHRDSRDIALQYAMGLVNLAIRQFPQGCAATIRRLEDLYREHRDSRDIAFQYAKGLFILTLSQDESEIPATVDTIAAVLRSHPGAIPEFRVVLDLFPGPKNHYQSLLEL